MSDTAETNVCPRCFLPGGAVTFHFCPSTAASQQHIDVPPGLLAPLVAACERIADALERALPREAWPQPPPICTGTGLERTARGVCPICGVAIELAKAAILGGADRVLFACAPHAYVVRVADPDGLLDDRAGA